MSAAAKLAEVLKRHKGLDGSSARYDPPAPDKPSPAKGAKARPRRRGVRCAGLHELTRLQVSLRAAVKRAVKAERALAATRKASWHRIRLRQLSAAWKRIEKLEAENARLKKRLRQFVEKKPINAKG